MCHSPSVLSIMGRREYYEIGHLCTLHTLYTHKQCIYALRTLHTLYTNYAQSTLHIHNAHTMREHTLRTQHALYTHCTYYTVYTHIAHTIHTQCTQTARACTHTLNTHFILIHSNPISYIIFNEQKIWN